MKIRKQVEIEEEVPFSIDPYVNELELCDGYIYWEDEDSWNDFKKDYLYYVGYNDEEIQVHKKKIIKKVKEHNKEIIKSALSEIDEILEDAVCEWNNVTREDVINYVNNWFDKQNVKEVESAG